MKTYYIYTLTNPNNGEVFYVGCTYRPKEREIKHKCWNPKKQKSRRRVDIKIKDRYIIKNKIVPVFCVVDKVRCTYYEAIELEMYWIKSFVAQGYFLTNTNHAAPCKDYLAKVKSLLTIIKQSA